MREIKFRAWYKEENRMIYTNYTQEEYENGFFLTLSNGKWFIADCEIDNVMQYTGLKDKNGKEIYEGDILEGYFRKNVEGKKDLSIGKTIWYQNGFYIGFGFEDDLKISLYNLSAKTILVSNYLDRFEIIGNIYENPELLK